MANQSRITIIAELQDRLTGPSTKAKKAVEDLGRSSEKAGAQAAKGHEKAAKAAEKTENSLDGVSGASSRLGKAIGQTETKMSRALGGMEQDAKDAASRMDKALGTAGEEGGRKAISNFKSAGARIVTEAESTGKTAGQKIKEGIEKGMAGIDTSGLTDKVGAAGVVGAAMASVQRDGLSRSAAVANGTSPEDMRALTDTVYGRNFGEDYAQVARGGGIIMGTFDVEAGSPEAEQLLSGNMTLAQIYGLDEERLALGVKILMDADNLTAEQANDVMAGVLRAAAPAARDEIIDNINEYLDDFAGSGMSATAQASNMAAASQIGGQYGSDMTGDLQREWTTRLLTRDKAAMDEYRAMGMDPEELITMISEGRADEAFQMTARAVHDEDDNYQAQRADGVYGTPAESLGYARLDEYTGMWMEEPKTASAYEGVMAGMQSDLAEGPGAAFGRMIRAASESVVAIGDAIAPTLTVFFNGMTKLAPLAGPLMLLFTGLTGFKMAKKGLDALKSVAGFAGLMDSKGAGAAKGVGLVSGAMTGLKTALTKHPIIGMAAIVWGAVEAFGFLYENVEPVRVVVDALADVFQTIDDKIRSIGEGIEELIREKIPALEEPMNNMETNFEAYDNGAGQKAIEDTKFGGNPVLTYIMEKVGVNDWARNNHLMKADEEETPGHADGGWTGPGARTYGERGTEFVVSNHAARKMESTAPGALAHINATGTVPTATAALGGNIQIIIQDAGDPQATAQAVRIELAKIRREEGRGYSDLANRGGR